MKRLGLFLILFSVVISSCEKDSDKSSADTFFKIASFPVKYTTESCIELTDRSVLICGSSVGNAVNDPNYGEGDPVMAKYDSKGKLLWLKVIPKTQYLLQKAIPLKNGGFVLAGYDDQQGSSKFTVSLYDNDGSILLAKSFYNQSGAFIFAFNTIDIIELQNGNFAVAVVRTRNIVNDWVFPVVYILDPFLNVIVEKNYTNDVPEPTGNFLNFGLAEHSDGNVYMTGRVNFLSDITPDSTIFLMKLLSGSYDMAHYSEPVGELKEEISSTIALDNSGNAYIATAEHLNVNSNNDPLFLITDDKPYTYGKKVSIKKISPAGKFILERTYSGYQRNGFIKKIISTSDGGFIMVGTANLNDNLNDFSNSNILLVKVDGNLNQQWMREISKEYQTIGVDVQEISTGYLIGATIRTFNEELDMLAVKVDFNGEL